MDDTLTAKLEEVEHSLVKTYELALTYGDEGTKNINTFQELYEKILKIRNKATHSDQALEKSKDHTTVENLEREYASQLEKLNNFDAKKTKDYKAFQKRLKEIKESTEPSTSHNNRLQKDDIVMETQIQIMDPLTKRKMENPVKNKVCGHNYEKSAILQAIKINHRMRCPVAGCGNNKFIDVKHLIDNDELRMHIMKQNTEGLDDNDDQLM